MTTENTAHNNLPEYDIAVIGGGVSGIYTAWRLMTDGVAGSEKLKSWAAQRSGKLRIAVFEGSERIGGRLLSAKAPGLPNITCELGGMRYVSSQVIVASLVENALKLPRHEQAVDEPQNLAFLRGSHLRNADLSDAAKLPYHLAADEKAWLSKGNTASNFIGWATEKLLPEVGKLNGEALEKYLQGAELDGTPLYQHGFWNFLAKAMSHEAYLLATTTVGYDSLGMNANAVDSIAEYFNFTPTVKYYLLNDGYDAVPWTLQQQFEAAGGEVKMKSWLQGFDATTLNDGTIGVKMLFHGPQANVSARAVVLAMPKRSIELLRQQGPVLDPDKSPQFRWLMNSVEPVELYKMFIAYDRPWWEADKVSKGRSVTDTPIRQCYYWGVEGQQPGADPANTNAILMVYNDMLSSTFWGGLRTAPLGPGDAVHWTRPGGPNLDDARNFHRKTPSVAPAAHIDHLNAKLHHNWRMHPAPHAMVMEMHRQLVEMHNIRNAPEPFEAAFMDWADDPYGGAVHFWNSGYRSWEVLKAMTHPVDDFPCYVCGEAWSTNQTWVEGALQTSEIVLQDHFGLPKPKWLKG